MTLGERGNHDDYGRVGLSLFPRRRVALWQPCEDNVVVDTRVKRAGLSVRALRLVAKPKCSADAGEMNE